MPRTIHTLGQAREAGLQLIAICDNMLCRCRRELDLVAVIEFVGARHPLTPLLGEKHFSERLRCPRCKSQGAFIWLMETPEPKPLTGALSYAVNRWPAPDSHALIETVLRANSEVVANVGFDAVTRSFPGDYLTLQQRGRVIRDTRFRIIVGGRT